MQSAHARYAHGHEMATLNATKLLLLTNQPKLTLTVTLTVTDTVTVIFYAHFVDTHKKVVSL